MIKTVSVSLTEASWSGTGQHEGDLLWRSGSPLTWPGLSKWIGLPCLFRLNTDRGHVTTLLSTNMHHFRAISHNTCVRIRLALVVRAGECRGFIPRFTERTGAALPERMTNWVFSSSSTLSAVSFNSESEGDASATVYAGAT